MRRAVTRTSTIKIVAKLLLLMTSMMLAIANPARGAENYPHRLIKLIVPYPPGGGIDPTARFFAHAMEVELGQPIVILNVGGASGQIGTQQAARSAADGYTLLFASVAPNSILPAVLPNMSYTNEDFAPISLVGTAAYVLVGNPSLPANNIDELLHLIKSNPTAVGSYASSGTFGGPHLAGALFNILSNGQMTHVPYRGDGPAVTALLSGEVPIAFASAPSVTQQIKEGRLKAFGVSGNEGSPLLPNIEALGKKMPGLEVSQWYGLMAPLGTPPDIILAINGATRKALAKESLAAQFVELGVVPKPTSPTEFQTFVDGEILKYRSLAQKANIVAEQSR
jgi:tripartite-type tricarboxylate transporter receptor subunit TctC